MRLKITDVAVGVVANGDSDAILPYPAGVSRDMIVQVSIETTADVTILGRFRDGDTFLPLIALTATSEITVVPFCPQVRATVSTWVSGDVDVAVLS